jgi:hypothetical protein
VSQCERSSGNVFADIGHPDPDRALAISAIRMRAEAHRADYPTFSITRFMEDVRGKPLSWLRWAKGQTTARLNRALHNERQARRAN